MWKIRRPRRPKVLKVIGIFSGVVFTLLGWVHYSAKGKMYVLGLILMVIGLVNILLWLFSEASDS